jgi:uridine phosphorylase
MKREGVVYMIEPEDVKKNAVRCGASLVDLRVPETAILTFNRTVLEQLNKVCDLHERKWLGAEHAPYCSISRCWEGKAGDRDVCVFVPPIGASPMAAFCEELICFGARRILLLCASWGLGEDCLKKGQIHLPTFAVGYDGTSFHYGNVDFRIAAEPVAFDVLADSLANSGVAWERGGVGCCEAFYRITPEMVNDYRDQGCLSMENGEVAVMYTLARVYRIQVGVLLQPYIDLKQGFDISYMDGIYHDTCRSQALIAVDAIGKF